MAGKPPNRGVVSNGKSLVTGRTYTSAGGEEGPRAGPELAGRKPVRHACEPERYVPNRGIVWH